MLSFFKLGLYSLAFVVNGLETALNASQESYTYREVLEGSCYVKVLRVLQATPNCPGNMGIGGIKKAGEYFAYIYRRGIIYIIVAYFKGFI